MFSSFEIKGKVALVSGANRGIGKAIVTSLIQSGASKVYAAVRKPDSALPLVQELGDSVVPIELDLSEPETVTAAAKRASDVDLVVNNGGVLRIASPLASHAIEDLRFELEVNVFGLLRMAQAFAPVLKTNGGGAFVQLNSVASLQSFPDFATYCASKAAAYSITQALRSTLADQGTLVLSVHPGPIKSDMADQAGMGEIGEPPSVVGDGIVEALRSGEFHLFPDSMAKSMWEAYQGFARAVVEGASSE